MRTVYVLPTRAPVPMAHAMNDETQDGNDGPQMLGYWRRIVPDDSPPSSAMARVKAIEVFHEQWHAKQPVSFEPTCEACFLLAQLREREREVAEWKKSNETWFNEAKKAHAEATDLDREVERLREALDILTRACEAGAYVGKTSPAVIQARHHLTRRPAPDEERHDMVQMIGGW